MRTVRLPKTVAFYLQASIVLFFLAGSSAPTPLYSTYQAEWGFSPITTTVVFGVYALAVLAALLVFGSLSDFVGRRPVLFTALLVQAATMVVFATAGGVPELMIARVIQGLSTGAAVGAIGAGMLDIDRPKGTIANAVAPLLGTASGALLAGILVQYLPSPTTLVYLVLLAIFVIQAAGVLFIAESASPKPGALASLRPAFGVPPRARRPLLVAAPALIAVWSLAGFYGALGPTLVRLLSGSDSHVLGGLALFVFAGSGAVVVLLLRSASGRSLMLFGTTMLMAGVALTLVSMSTTSTALFFIGTAVAGVGFGGGFQGALRTVAPLAAVHERAGLLSTLYVVSYLALGLPAVIGGCLVVYGGGFLATAREYGAAVIVLAALALAGVLFSSGEEESPAAMATPVASRVQLTEVG